MSSSTPRVPSLAGVAARGPQPAVDHPPKIEAERLNFYYGDTRALQDISVRIQPNLVTAFIGTSGCGKSTFLRTLNRMNDIIPRTRVEGRVLIDGADVTGSVGVPNTGDWQLWATVSAGPARSNAPRAQGPRSQRWPGRR